MADNVIPVPPRRRRVHHKGMWGWVEYHPRNAQWSYSVKYQVTHTFEGEARSEAEAALQVKMMIDLLAGGFPPTRSVE